MIFSYEDLDKAFQDFSNYRDVYDILIDEYVKAVKVADVNSC